MLNQHPLWPVWGDHLWGRWMPYDKKHEYRVCVHPDCHESEKREVKG